MDLHEMKLARGQAIKCKACGVAIIVRLNRSLHLACISCAKDVFMSIAHRACNVRLCFYCYRDYDVSYCSLCQGVQVCLIRPKSWTSRMLSANTS